MSTLERAVAPLRIVRSRDDRVIAGVAGGVGARLGVDAYLVRLFAVVSGLAFGAGVVAYLVLWAISLPPDAARPDGWRSDAARPDARSDAARPDARSDAARSDARSDAALSDGAVAAVAGAAPAEERSVQRAVAAGCIGLGILLLLRELGLWLGDSLMWPVVLGAIGAAVAGVRSTPVERVLTGRMSFVRVLVGLGLVAAGVAALAARDGSLDEVRDSAVTAALAVAGLTVVFWPWLGRLARELGAERRERVRSEERAALAAHLHDSVLQTLALIQRNAHDPRRTVTLARRQERELRAWLYGTDDGAGPDTLHRAVDRAAQEVEADHDVRVDVVVVGDCPVDDTVRALVGAIREALVNAAKHSGADTVAAYVEVEDDTVSAFIRDRGRGFVPAAVPGERRGIADSIRGRVGRVGGSVELTSQPGSGTEVHVVVPLPAGAR
jgi:signal transduction histidine kinase/phage shock protein PspC (stress-responsive transcriptional regulator)